MKTTKSFRDLIVWQKAHQLVLLVYKLSKKFPKEERYCLTSQFRRASISVAANISEGYVKRTRPDKIRLLNIAQGSLEECRYYILLSSDLEYGFDDKIDSLSEEVSKLLNAYLKAIEVSK